VIEVSAKKAINIDQLLEAIVHRIPPPSTADQADHRSSSFKGLIVDSCPNKGAVCLVAAKSGLLKPGEEFRSLHQPKIASHGRRVQARAPQPIDSLSCGLVGYLISSMRSTKRGSACPAMVFCGLFPVSQEDIDSLEASLSKAHPQTTHPCRWPRTRIAALGRGWRLGFLGLLHMDVFRSAWRRSTTLTIVDVTSPSVMPPDSEVAEHFEPLCRATVITRRPSIWMLSAAAASSASSYIDSDRILLEARLPLSEIVIDLVDVLKTRSSGYASFHYEEAGWQSCPAGEAAHADDPADRARQRAVVMATKLAEELPRQQFLIKVQIKAGNNKVVASSQIKPFRKRMLCRKFGTDRTRRQKLLAAQREGKRRLRMVGNVEIPRDAFIKVLKS
uniref:EFG_C domain-containing protein n=1 Tax=Macrostomum lignano TaxID=282301 RepID=A0A1I8F9G4_9PLAT